MRLSQNFTVWMGVIAAVVFGVAIALQSKINGQLGFQLNDGLLAALVCFSIGLLLCFLLITIQLGKIKTALRELGAAIKSGQVKWWMLWGGIGGAIMVALQSGMVNQVGLAAFTVSLIAGQAVGGLLIDRVGMAGSPIRKLTLFRTLGAVVTVVAAFVIVTGADLRSMGSVWLLLPFVSGIIQSWQQATIGVVRTVSHSPVLATTVSFLAGTILLAVSVLVQSSFKSWPQTFPTEIYLYFGGVLGLIMILSVAFGVRLIGVLLYTLVMTATQLAVSLVIDIIMPVSGAPSISAYLGVGLAILGAVITAYGQFRSAGKKAEETTAKF